MNKRSKRRIKSEDILARCFYEFRFIHCIRNESLLATYFFEHMPTLCTHVRYQKKIFPQVTYASITRCMARSSVRMRFHYECPSECMSCFFQLRTDGLFVIYINVVFCQPTTIFQSNYHRHCSGHCYSAYLNF